MVEDWKRQAEEGGVSLSKFVVERVEDSINVKRARGVILVVSNLRDAEEELKRLLKGVRRFDKDLTELLRKDGSYTQ
ncbi:MAG: hypothetical protein ACUVV4_08715, partial [Candidatus Bathyarchaeia archaeon]